MQHSRRSCFANYIKKDKEPNWDDLPQVKPYWEEFKQYKLSKDAQEKSDQAKKNAANKKCSHHLGASGHSKAVRKWQNTEQDFMDRSIRPATWDWPDRLLAPTNVTTGKAVMTPADANWGGSIS